MSYFYLIDLHFVNREGKTYLSSVDSHYEEPPSQEKCYSTLKEDAFTPMVCICALWMRALLFCSNAPLFLTCRRFRCREPVGRVAVQCSTRRHFKLSPLS